MFNTLNFIRQLIKFSPRQGSNETKAGKFITDLLAKNQIKFQLQKFNFQIPHDIKAELTADGRHIPCQASSFVSGKIKGKNNLISSMMFDLDYNFTNLNFNPLCDDISVPSRALKFPALAFAKKDLLKILAAKQVRGEVIVKPIKHQSQNILVGNLTNPENIIFTHYDSINLGVYDNASGVAVTLKLLLENPRLIKNTLFVISGNEELSYDFPTYWGYGYRVFEKKYLSLMKTAQKMIIIDCIGNGQAKFLTDAYFIALGFPIKNMKKLLSKTAMISSNIDKLMAVYHSNADNLTQVNEKDLNQAYSVILKKLI